MAFPELYILRHGETVWNAEGRLQGERDSPLTETGLAQAARQGEILAARELAGFHYWSSPQGRAIATAQIAWDVPPQKDDRLREIGMGDWSGQLREEVCPRAKLPPDLQEDLCALYRINPTGETFADLQARARSFLVELNAPAVIVTHGITSRMLRGIVLGADLEALGDLPGGQGVVFHIKDGQQTRLI